MDGYNDKSREFPQRDGLDRGGGDARVDARRGEKVYNNLYQSFRRGDLKRERVSESDIKELVGIFKTTSDSGVKEGIKEILGSIHGEYHL